MGTPALKTLLKAIRARYTLATSLETSIGLLYLNEAPKSNETGVSVTKPYTIMFIISGEDHEDTLGLTLKLEYTRIQFSVFSDVSSTAVAGFGDILMARFDFADMVYTNDVDASALDCERVGSPVLLKNPVGDWQYTVDYRISYQLT